MADKVANPSIEAIASEVGVSASLVSKVLNGRMGTTRVAARTVQAIQERARGMGYRKNSSAAALATGRQNVVAAFIHQMGVPGSGLAEGLVEGIAGELVQQEQRMLLHFYNNAQQFRAQVRSLHAGVADGLIVGGLHHDDLLEDLREIQQRGVAIVTVHEKVLDAAIPNVGSDQVQIGRLATAHLIERGCRRIAHVRHQPERYEGYREALREAGLPQDPTLVFTVNSFGFEAGEAAVRHFASRGVAYDGVFAQSDLQAIGAINALTRAGRRVPEEVRVIGVDNSPFCDVSIVPLSSVAQLERERGRSAARLLHDLVMRKKKVRSIWVDPVLHPRESSR